jgi:hypothetical protein
VACGWLNEVANDIGDERRLLAFWVAAMFMRKKGEEELLDRCNGFRRGGVFVVEEVTEGIESVDLVGTECKDGVWCVAVMDIRGEIEERKTGLEVTVWILGRAERGLRRLETGKE